MKKIAFFLMTLNCVAFLCYAQDWNGIAVPADPGTGKVWQLDNEHSDNFNYTGKAVTDFTSRWIDNNRGGWSGPGQTQFSANHSMVSDGNLIIMARLATGIPGKRTYCGYVTTKNPITFPVFTECNMMLNGTLLASDFWLLSADEVNEIDIQESYGADPVAGKNMQTNYHIFQRSPFLDLTPGKGMNIASNPSADLSKTWHRYGLYWKSATEFIFYFDGKPVRYTNKSTDLVDPRNRFFDQAMHIIFNVEDQEWRSNAGLTPTDAELANPAINNMYVAWVRTYKAVAGACTPTAIVPYIYSNGTWAQTANVTVSPGGQIILGPQPVTGGTWAWTGCGTSGTAREQTFYPTASCTATATYTNSCGAKSTQVFTINVNSSATNVALNKSASQSGTYGTGTANKAVDGNTNGVYSAGSVTHTNNTANAWWQVDLGGIYNISTINVFNRTDCCGSRLSNFYVFVSDVPFSSTSISTTKSQAGVGSYLTSGQAGSPTAIATNRSGRYLRVQLAGANFLSLAEVQVLGIAKAAINEGYSVGTASIFPNPAHSELTITGLDNGRYNLRIYNLLGALCFNSRIDISEASLIDINSLPVGLYTLHLQNQASQYTFRFTKK